MATAFIPQLLAAEAANQSMLCVGLDPEPAKFPTPWQGDARRIFDFCAAIVDATADQVIAFKPQIAYFAAHRAEDQLERLIAHIHRVAPQVPVILDAKRGDIGSTAQQYAVEAFERYQADAVTLSPFMGFDSIEPYLAYDGKGLFLLCRTSNPGGSELQSQRLAAAPGSPADAPGDLLFEHIAKLAAGPWNRSGRLGLVVGATYPAEIKRVRALAATLPLLIPGVGAQGGDAQATVRAGWRGSLAGVGGAGTSAEGSAKTGANTSAIPSAIPSATTSGPIIVSSSRAVLYASAGADFASAARVVAQATRLALQAARC